jgi:hypothetical protein
MFPAAVPLIWPEAVTLPITLIPLDIILPLALILPEAVIFAVTLTLSANNIPCPDVNSYISLVITLVAKRPWDP